MDEEQHTITSVGQDAVSHLDTSNPESRDSEPDANDVVDQLYQQSPVRSSDLEAVDALEVILSRRRARKEIEAHNRMGRTPISADQKQGISQLPTSSRKSMNSSNYHTPQHHNKDKAPQHYSLDKVHTRPKQLTAEQVAQYIVAGVSMRELEELERRGKNERGRGAAVGLEKALDLEESSTALESLNYPADPVMALLESQEKEKNVFNKVFASKRAKNATMKAMLATADAFDDSDD